MDDNYRFDTVADHVGQELGVTDWVLIDQQRVNTFADCTDDHQWIHVDPERCRKESPFGGPVAHGFLTLSLLAPMLGEIGVAPADTRQVVNCGVNDVRFTAPVPVGARVRARMTLTDVKPRGDDRLMITLAAVMEIEDKDQPALSGNVVLLLFR